MDEPNDETLKTPASDTGASSTTPETDKPATTAGDATVESAAAATPPPDPKPLPDTPKTPGPSLGERIKLPSGLKPSTILTVILGVLVILLAIMVFAPGLAPLKVGAARQAASEDDRADVERVAGRFAETLLTFSYRELDDHLTRIEKDATGSFRQGYLETMKAARKALADAKAQSSGRVLEVATTDLDDESVRAIVYVEREIRNEKQPDGQTVPVTLELSMVKTSKGWKVDQVGQLEQVRI